MCVCCVDGVGFGTNVRVVRWQNPICRRTRLRRIEESPLLPPARHAQNSLQAALFMLMLFSLPFARRTRIAPSRGHQTALCRRRPELRRSLSIVFAVQRSARRIGKHIIMRLRRGNSFRSRTASQGSTKGGGVILCALMPPLRRVGGRHSLFVSLSISR